MEQIGVSRYTKDAYGNTALSMGNRNGVRHTSNDFDKYAEDHYDDDDVDDDDDYDDAEF